MATRHLLYSCRDSGVCTYVCMAMPIPLLLLLFPPSLLLLSQMCVAVLVLSRLPSLLPLSLSLSLSLFLARQPFEG